MSMRLIARGIPGQPSVAAAAAIRGKFGLAASGRRAESAGK
jgi:hypothetical protein